MYLSQQYRAEDEGRVCLRGHQLLSASNPRHLSESVTTCDDMDIGGGETLICKSKHGSKAQSRDMITINTKM
jgi:hypothetical protein